MRAYNFQKQFAPAIAAGVKRSTIRALRKDGYRPTRGEEIKLYTGMRTKSCRLLLTVKVRRVRPVLVAPADRIVAINGYFLKQRGVAQLAKREGFASADEFYAFFRERRDGKPVSGHLIEW